MKVSVVGVGKLGLPLACILAKAGHEVTAADVNPDLIESLQSGGCPIRETNLDDLLNEVQLAATTDIVEAARLTEITYIVVPTPSLSDHEFSNEYVLSAIRAVGKGISQKISEHTVVVVSTIMPGASSLLIGALQESSGRTVGQMLNYAYSPEFIALGSVIEDMMHPDFILIGEANLRAGAILSHMYSTYINDEIEVRRVSVINAEIAKISLNCFLTIKISFANMISEFCETFMGADAAQVCAVIGADSRIGQKFLQPGTASGGPCLPRDLRALDSSMARQGVSAELVEAAMSINDRQVQRLKSLVLSFDPHKIAVLGTAYKPGTHITEASVGLALIEQLRHSGAKVDWFDTMVTGGADSALLAVSGADVVVLTTADPLFAAIDYQNTVVIDCWNIARHGSNIHQLGRG